MASPAEKTEFYTPKEYVFALAERHPDLFIPNISVNSSKSFKMFRGDSWITLFHLPKR